MISNVIGQNDMRVSDSPQYLKLCSLLRERVYAGEIRPGQKIPTERDLESKYKISRTTVGKALARLRAEGVLCRIEGRKGNFVAKDHNRDEEKSLVRIARFVGLRRDSDKAVVDHGALEGVYDSFQGSDIELAVDFAGCQGGKSLDCHALVNSRNGKGVGLIVWYDPIYYEQGLLDMAKSIGMHVVFIDSYTREEESDFVVTDNIGGMHQMVDYLVGLGHRKICYVRNLSDVGRVSNRDRHTGFLRGVVENGLNLSDVEVVDIKDDFASESNKFVEKLAGENLPFTAVVANHDVIAIELEKSFLSKGIRIPEDISLAGYDDIDWSSVLPVPLTTIRQDFYGMGKEAGEILKMRLENGENHRFFKEYLPAKLIVRGSTGPAKTNINT